MNVDLQNQSVKKRAYIKITGHSVFIHLAIWLLGVISIVDYIKGLL